MSAHAALENRSRISAEINCEFKAIFAITVELRSLMIRTDHVNFQRIAICEHHPFKYLPAHDSAAVEIWF